MPFFGAPFRGILCLFMVKMGQVTAERLSEVRSVGLFLVIFGIFIPIATGMTGVLVGGMAGLSLGGTVLLGVLAASASYIAAPAAMRLSLPEANPSLAMTPVLGVTFPFNITIGIPLLYWFGTTIWG